MVCIPLTESFVVLPKNIVKKETLSIALKSVRSLKGNITFLYVKPTVSNTICFVKGMEGSEGRLEIADF